MESAMFAIALLSVCFPARPSVRHSRGLYVKQNSLAYDVARSLGSSG